MFPLDLLKGQGFTIRCFFPVCGRDASRNSVCSTFVCSKNFAKERIIYRKQKTFLTIFFPFFLNIVENGFV